ncbi:MFS transporter [Angustibacter aerolatus]|uniref:MFS transporter n=1 Tax=Angustibacter aerolatus TaxID=1162965 RepID=A0ABQ6JMH2_9ACTN|nr:MFS transporter [Angustibacter aerolatus]GMA88524.1 MFS transporter [Angustibacter aerolatus]
MPPTPLETQTDTAVDAAPRPARRTLGFWWLTVSAGVLLAASAVPAPLYVLYQARWGFSATTLTIVFAVYVVALLLALLTVGSLSDHLGRRPVLAAAIALDAVAMLLFVAADGVSDLLVARIVQGLATGAAMGTFGAALVDLEPRHRPGLASLVNGMAASLGLGVGALGSGLLAQSLASPTTAVFGSLAVVLVVAGVGLWLVPETVERRPGALASLRPSVHVPPSARRRFAAVAPVLIATWATGGLYLSLVPSLVAGVLDVHSHLVAGAVVSALMLPAAVASYAGRHQSNERLLRAGTLLLLVGTAGTVAAIEPRVAARLRGRHRRRRPRLRQRLPGRPAHPRLLGHRRAPRRAVRRPLRHQYLGFSVPAVIAGVVAPTVGLQTTGVAYGVFVILLAAVAAVLSGVQARTTAAAAD